MHAQVDSVTSPGSDEVATSPCRHACTGRLAPRFPTRMEEKAALRRRSHARGQESARWGQQVSQTGDSGWL
jgi:hypothetical protein